MIDLVVTIIELRSSGIHRDIKIISCHITRFLNGLEHDLDRFLIGFDIGCKSSLVSYVGRITFGLKNRLEVMEYLGPHAKSITEGICPDRHNHKFLKIDAVVRVGSSIENIHHGHGQNMRVGPTYIPVQRHTKFIGSGFGSGQRNTQDSVGSQPGFIVGAIEFDHQIIEITLVTDFGTDQSSGDYFIDVVNGIEHSFPQDPVLVLVAKLDRSYFPVEAPEGTAALPVKPDSVTISTSTVGLPRESRISLP